MENSFLHFEFDLFKIFYAERIAKQSVPQPIFSPYSVGVCLSYLSNLVQSDLARQEIKNVLHCNEIDFSIFLSAFKDFESRIDHQTTKDVLKTAHILFTDISITDISENQTGVLPEIVNYSIVDPASSTINKAVKSRTSGRISRLMNPLTKLSHNSIVMSSISLFQCFWKRPFDSFYHHTFHGFDNVYSIPMMQMKLGDVLYSDDKTCFMISIPYSQSEFSFVAVLPRKKSFKKFIKFLNEFNDHKFVHLMNSLQPRKMNIIIPKFSLQTNSFDLMNFIPRFGIKHKLVMPQNRNFSQFCQKCTFELNELGSIPLAQIDYSAACNTPIKCEKLKSDKKSFKRPFIYFLVKNQPKAVIFSGVFLKPTTEDLSDSL